MSDATQNNDTRTTNDKPHDEIRVTRPGWMTDEQWTSITAKVDDKLDELIEIASVEVRGPWADVPCTDRSWCTMTDPAEHASYHCGDVVPLAKYDAATDHGFSCYLLEERGERPRVEFSGHLPGVDFHHEFAVDAMRVMSLLWATNTPEARAALDGLLDQLANGGGRS